MALQNLSLVEKLLIALVFAVVVLWVGHEFKVYLPDVEVWIAELGFFAPIGFVALFVGLSPLFVSIDVLCFAAGLLFSIVVGELAVIVATYLSATIIFFLGRYWLRDRVLAFTAKHQKLAILDKLISGDNALKLMFLLRLTPLPFAMISYALSVTHVKFWHYLAATSGILIYNCSLVYLGYTTKHLSGVGGGDSQMGFASRSMLVFGLLVLLAILMYVAKIASDNLKQLNMQNLDK